MIYAIWFDLDDPPNRSSMDYFSAIPLNPYLQNMNEGFKLYNSGYCGALFLGIL